MFLQVNQCLDGDSIIYSTNLLLTIYYMYLLLHCEIKLCVKCLLVVIFLSWKWSRNPNQNSAPSVFLLRILLFGHYGEETVAMLVILERDVCTQAHDSGGRSDL